MSPLSSFVVNLGERIRARRKFVGMTQADLASAMGISFQQVQKYEKGITAISQVRMEQICDILNLPADYFTSSAGMIGKSASHGPESVTPLSIEGYAATPEGLRLIESYLRIVDPRLRTSVLDFVASVADRRAADR